MSGTGVDTPRDIQLMPSIRDATVTDAMHPGIISCPASATLPEVARVMATHRVHCIAVTGIAREGRTEPSVWGIISDLDLMRAGVGVGPGEIAGALALEPVVTVDPTTSVTVAAELMLQHGVSHIVVVDPETRRPSGVLSTLDVIDALGSGWA
jgi:CBS domain-containing protein